MQCGSLNRILEQEKDIDGGNQSNHLHKLCQHKLLYVLCGLCKTLSPQPGIAEFCSTVNFYLRPKDEYLRAGVAYQNSACSACMTSGIEPSTIKITSVFVFNPDKNFLDFTLESIVSIYKSNLSKRRHKLGLGTCTYSPATVTIGAGGLFEPRNLRKEWTTQPDPTSKIGIGGGVKGAKE